ncbi:hypothetical protein [Paenibacillus antarcticus]|uniref:Uncharacterized protein n=1 Tax=Paenibacillus antarcticus TaxID=253703 RepID=A0A168QCK5_9BACL|nr:hypothetical protein [Paenibacillus antarcticus]OAB47634.1 hypothetical protein PBAT_05315 [Paenibacillus antarcticus]
MSLLTRNNDAILLLMFNIFFSICRNRTGHSYYAQLYKYARIMSRLVREEQRFVAGMNTAYTGLENIAEPVIAGFLFDYNINYCIFV